MFKPFFLLAFAAIAQSTVIRVPSTPSLNTSGAPLEAFVSYSVEFAFLPDYAGNLSSPNTFTNNLLNNIGNLTGTKPHIRTGGNTQDYAIYNASLPYSTNGTYDIARSDDYPTTLYIGPSFFESYNTLPNTKFTHGFNLAFGGNNTEGWQSLIEMAPVACRALSHGNLLAWEYGNEPDTYAVTPLGSVRPPSWNDVEYVSQWLNGTRKINSEIAKACPGLANSSIGYFAPSLVVPPVFLDPYVEFKTLGLNADDDIKYLAIHNYIGSSTQPGISLANSLLNHSLTVSSLTPHAIRLQNLSFTGIPYILGETNSLYNQGTPGLSNSFGAALWGIDYSLYAASIGIKRMHMHQGTDYRYQAFQPISTNKTSIGTKAPYYGNVAVAAFLGNLTDSSKSVRVSNIPLNGTDQAVYVAYVDNVVKKIAVISLREFNGSSISTSRPKRTYDFKLDAAYFNKTVVVKRLLANGSDAITGITWNGWSYNYELDNGKPVRLDNVTVGETAFVKGGVVSVEVEDSSAVVLEFA